MYFLCRCLLFNCFEALFGEINSRHTKSHPAGRMQISGRQVVHKGIKISGQNLVRRRVSWFCVNALRRNVGTITAFDDSISREKEPFDFENELTVAPPHLPTQNIFFTLRRCAAPNPSKYFGLGRPDRMQIRSFAFFLGLAGCLGSCCSYWRRWRKRC